MNKQLLQEIKKNRGLYEYLEDHSIWYIYLNRSPKYYQLLLKEYKKFKHEKNISKVEKAVDNIELISNLIKYVE